MIDARCPKCETIRRDLLLRERDEAGEYVYPPCQKEGCDGVVERVMLGAAAGVVDDSIPGGVLIEHALCNADGTPRRYYSKTDINREAKARGWTNVVEHIGSQGSDRNRHTQRFI